MILLLVHYFKVSKCIPDLYFVCFICVGFVFVLFPFFVSVHCAVSVTTHLAVDRYINKKHLTNNNNNCY